MDYRASVRTHGAGGELQSHDSIFTSLGSAAVKQGESLSFLERTRGNEVIQVMLCEVSLIQT